MSLARIKFFSWFFAPSAMAPSFSPAPCFPEEFVECLRVYCMGEEL